VQMEKVLAVGKGLPHWSRARLEPLLALRHGAMDGAKTRNAACNPCRH
jgi:hypothetical protein